MSANHTDRMCRDVKVLRGQILTSLVKLSRRWKWDRKTVRNFLRNLEYGSEVRTAKTNRYTLITICNYERYQGNTIGEGVERGQQPPQQAGQLGGQQKGHEQELRKHLESTKKEKLAAKSLADDKVMEAYNRICKSFPKIRKIDGARSQLIDIACSDIDDWEEFFTMVEASGEWLKSQPFTDFEWFLNNRLKILERKYLDKGQPEEESKRSSDLPVF